MGAHVVTVNEVLDGHVALDIQCLDRIYLNAYVMKLQTSAQVVAFLSGHLGYPFPSPALFNQIGGRFRRAVASYAEANDIPWIKFGKDDDKLATMGPHLRRQAASGRSGVAAIGVAQEFQRVWAAAEGKTSTGTPRWSFYKADRRVTCYYFYLWDADFGPAFIKVCAYFPYPGKVWINGHEWAKRQATKAGIAFTELSNGFAACADPQALQSICDRLGPGAINVFVQRWLARLPMPFTPAHQDAGYWWEAVMNPPRDLGSQARLHDLADLQLKPRACTRRILEAERVGQGCVLASPAFERIAHPTVNTAGCRTPALRFGDPRVMALTGALCHTLLAATGFTNKNLRVLIAGLLGSDYHPNQMTYDLRRLRLNGLIRRIPRSNRYMLTPDGIRIAVFYTKVHNRLLVPLTAADQPQAPPELRRALATITHHVDEYATQARLPAAA